MVGQAAAAGCEILDALFERLLHVVDRVDGQACGLAQTSQVRRKARIGNVQRLLRTESRQNAHVKAIFLRQQTVIMQVVRRVVRRAERADIARGDERARRALRGL